MHFIRNNNTIEQNQSFSQSDGDIEIMHLNFKKKGSRYEYSLGSGAAYRLMLFSVAKRFCSPNLPLLAGQ